MFGNFRCHCMTAQRSNSHNEFKFNLYNYDLKYIYKYLVYYIRYYSY